MESALAVAVLCLAASTATLASALPYLYWKCFRLESRAAELQQQIDTLDEALSRLLDKIGVPEESQ